MQKMQAACNYTTAAQDVLQAGLSALWCRLSPADVMFTCHLPFEGFQITDIHCLLFLAGGQHQPSYG
jgi:acyl-CoA synthetase (AMP-forming)/AMP-acid ligase II